MKEYQVIESEGSFNVESRQNLGYRAFGWELCEIPPHQLESVVSRGVTSGGWHMGGPAIFSSSELAHKFIERMKSSGFDGEFTA